MKRHFNLLLAFLLVTLSACNSNSNESSSSQTSKPPVDESILDTKLAYEIPSNPNVVIHYYNYAENYTNWLTWIWPHEPTSDSGARFYFQETETIQDRIWANLYIDTTKPMNDVLSSWDSSITRGKINFNESVSTLGIIIRNKSGSKEYDGDRYIDLTNKSKDGKTHLFVIEGSSEMFYDIDDVDFNMISSASLTSLNTIEASFYSPLKGNPTYVVTSNLKNLEIASATLSPSKKKVEIKLKDNFDLNNLSYTTILNVEGFGKRDVDYSKLYTSKDFEDKFVTDEQLGAIYSKDETTFKVWSPVASNITLKLFDNGLTGNAYKEVEMQRKENGVFCTTVSGNLDKKYYTYDVTIGNKTNQNVIDPYAVSAGVNGKRGEILDMDALNPQGWDDVKIPTIESQSKALVYELHVRDLTANPSWNGSEEKRAKYLGLCEENTTITVDNVTYPTGFDYIKTLGITHVQLQPFYDFNSVDEARMNDEEYVNRKYGGAYNWGYDPANYNVLEGSYSSDPYEGSVRVKEFKEVAKAYNNANIGIIMDVVFNHMANAATSSFEKIFPGYYFRGRNDSGAGADTACERAMFAKYMADVTANFVREYKIAGFRFDLMGLHTVDAMKKVATSVTNEVLKNNANTTPIIYGEGWSMYNGESIGTMADQTGCGAFDNIGAFNDVLRAGAKGSNSMGGDDDAKGWLAGETDLISYSKVVEGLNKQYSRAYSGSSVNYIECHDNLTLYDKLSLSNPNAPEEVIKQMDILGASLVYTAYGISFIQAGQEFMRSKEVDSSDNTEKIIHCSVTNRAYNRDSYNACDAINSLDWNRMVKYIDVVNAYKELIKLRKSQSILTPLNPNDTSRTVKSINDGSIIVNKITSNVETSSWKEVIIYYNNSSNTQTINVDEGYKLGFNNYLYIEDGEDVTNSIDVAAKQMVIIYR